MTPFAWFVGLFLPACAASGAAGLPRPTQMNMSQIQRPASPNTALAAPAGTLPAPDIVTPEYPVPATRLYALTIAVAEGQGLTWLAADYPAALQVHFVARSAVFNFPDLVAAQISPSGPGHSTLTLYSRSVYGYGDFGANRARLSAWLAALDRTLNSATER